MIFDISPGKTGTTSLANAMQLLGYKSCHGCPREHYQDFLGKVLVDDFSFNLLNDYEYIGNLLNYAYERLERRFPDALFICLERDDQAWLRSTRNQMRKNDWTGQPDRLTVGIVARLINNGCVHSEDEQHLLSQYRKHQAGVQEYFCESHERSDRLLTMQIEEGWEPLCEFLNKPVPDLPFPHLNTS